MVAAAGYETARDKGGALQSDHLSPKSDNSPKVCPYSYSAEEIILPHLFNIFTLKNDLRAVVDHIRQEARIWGGWLVNLVLTMSGFWVHMVLQPLPHRN